MRKLTELSENFKKKMFTVNDVKVLTIPFESFMLSPWPYLKKIENLLKQGDVKKFQPRDFKKFGSARKLYNFNIDNVSEY